MSVAPVETGTNNDLGRFGDEGTSSSLPEVVRFSVSKPLVLEDKMLLHYAKSYRPFELFVNENYKL